MTAAPATAPGRPFTPSTNVDFMKESATIAVSTRAKALKAQGRDIIDLGVGEPDFPTPAPIIAAAKKAMDEGATKYTATEGILPLRQAIAAEATAQSGGTWKIEANEVVVSNGSKQSLFNACFVLFSEGDEVLIPTPAWTSYYEMVGLAKAVAVPVHGAIANGLKPTAAELAAAATERTRGLMLNSPCNPTGATYSRDELESILRLADERGWWVIADEIYRHIAFDGPATTSLQVAPSRDRLIVVDGVAKSYAMTGWRIGWAIAPKAVAAAMTAYQSHTTSNPSSVSQYAALAALGGSDEIAQTITHMVGEFKARRDACLRVLADEPRIEVVQPDGAFYLFLRIGGDTQAFAKELLEQHDVAVVPGSAFLAPDWIRLAYATRKELAVEGLKRIVALYRAREGGA